MNCNFGVWLQDYLTTPEAFSTSMLNCFRPAVQFFPRKLLNDILDHADEMSMVLIFIFAMFIKFLRIIGFIHSIEVG